MAVAVPRTFKLVLACWGGSGVVSSSAHSICLLCHTHRATCYRGLAPVASETSLGNRLAISYCLVLTLHIT